MIANYHTHTYRCNHAVGTDEEYVIRAIERGLHFLGFSDHTPYIYFGDYYSSAKMLPDAAFEYFDSINALKEKYKGQIEIKVGFETEYFPLLWDKLKEYYKALPIDYIILGQHMVGNESTPDCINSFTPTKDKAALTRYVDQCIEALDTGAFSYVGHPDVFNYKDDDDFFRAESERLIKAITKRSIPLEINLVGVRYGRNYPNPLFWEVAGKLGAPAIIGCDAHAPSQVADPDELDAARRFADKYRVNIVDTTPVFKPF